MKPLFDEYARRNAKFDGVRLNVYNVTGWRIIASEDTPTNNTTVEFTFDRAIDENSNVDVTRLNPRLPRITQRTVTITRPTLRELLTETGVIAPGTNMLTAPVAVLSTDTTLQAVDKFKTAFEVDSLKPAFAAQCNFGDDLSVIYLDETTLRIAAKHNALGCRGHIDVTTSLEPESP